MPPDASQGVLDATESPPSPTALILRTKNAPELGSGALICAVRCRQRVRLVGDLGHHASAHGAATFTDGEAQLLFHRDRLDQLD